MESRNLIEADYDDIVTADYETRRGTCSGLYHETKAIGFIAMPVVFTLLFEWGLGVSTLMVVGKLHQDDKLAGAGLGTMYHQVTIMFGFGVLCALDTLVAQAHGAKVPRLIGLSLMRAFLVILIIAIPIGLTWGLCKYVLLLLQVEKPIAEDAGDYTLHLLPGLVPFLCYFALQKFLQGQEIVAPATIVGGVVNVFHFVLSQVLVHGYIWKEEWRVFGDWNGLGFSGAPLTLSISRSLLPLGLSMWILVCGHHKRVWPGWTMDVFNPTEIKKFLLLGLPTGVMVFVEVFGFEVNTFMSAYIGNTAEEKQASSAAQASLANFYLLAWMIPQGFAQAASVRVGFNIGLGNGPAARRATWLAFVIAFGISVISGVCFYLFRYQIARSFAPGEDSHDVVDKMVGVFPLAAICHVLDCMQALFAAVLRGVGRPMPGVIMNLIAYYLISTPGAYLCAFQLGWGLTGIWIGLTAAMVVVAAGLFIYVAMIDWDKEVIRARETVKESEYLTSMTEVAEQEEITDFATGNASPDRERAYSYQSITN